MHRKAPSLADANGGPHHPSEIGQMNTPYEPRRRPLAVIILFSLLLTLAMVAMIAFSARSQELDLKTILRCDAETAQAEADCDRSRALVIQYCTSCHTFAPIVMQQFDEGGWASLMNRHQGWIPNLPEADFVQIRSYLTANFRPDLDPPELPQELLDTWTSY